METDLCVSKTMILLAPFKILDTCPVFVGGGGTAGVVVVVVVAAVVLSCSALGIVLNVTFRSL